MFPVNILNTIKNGPEVCRIFCATANPVEVILAVSELGRGIMGVIDGFASIGRSAIHTLRMGVYGKDPIFSRIGIPTKLGRNRYLEN